MSELKRVVSGLDVHARCSDEHGFEADAFGTYISMFCILGAFSDRAYCLQIQTSKSVLVAFNHDVFRVDLQGNKRGIILVIDILEKLGHESSTSTVYVSC
jgi:hypothetical protein